LTPVLDKMQDYRINCLQHMNRMPSNRKPRIINDCKPKGRRIQERDTSGCV
jgi:hypothetical protein